MTNLQGFGRVRSMTNEEALEYLKELKPIPSEAYDTATKALEYLKELKPIPSEAYNMAIKALEKQIPKKPYKMLCSNGETYVHHCPNCGAWITPTVIIKNKYHKLEIYTRGCHVCFQAIDWSE